MLKTLGRGGRAGLGGATGKREGRVPTLSMNSNVFPSLSLYLLTLVVT